MLGAGLLRLFWRDNMKILSLTLLLFFFTQIISAQELPFQTGHTHDILVVKFSPDDIQLISYSAGDDRFCLWDVKSGRLLWRTETGFIQKANEDSNLKEFHWSEDGNFVVTKSMNGTYQTWNAKTGRFLSLNETKPDIKLISPSKKGVSLTKDYGKIIIIDGETKEAKEIRRFGNNSAFDTSNDGTMIAEGGSWGDASIRITETKTGKSWWLDGHPSVVKTIAFSPEGNYLAVAGSDKSIYVFDVAKRVLSKTLVGHTRPISSIAFTPDGKTLLSSSEDKLMKVWNWQEGKFLQDIKSEEDIFGVQKVTFSPDGKYFLTTSDRVEFRLWDAQVLKLVRNFKTNEKYESTNGHMTVVSDGVPVSSAIFSKDGKRILSSHIDGTLRTWDINQGEQVKSFKIGEAAFFIQVSPDDKTILAAIGRSDSLRIKLFNAKDGKEITKFDDEKTHYLEALSISPNGKHFATSSWGDVLLWDLDKNKPVRELRTGFSGDDAIAFSPDGKTLAVGGRSQNLFLFDVETGNKLWQLIPSYQPSELEISLTKQKEERQAVLNEAKAQRDRQAAIDTEILKKQVRITFEHYGDMTDPGEQRMLESSEPNKSKVKKTAEQANAIWLRLRNDSPLPIRIPTQSMYLSDPKCFYKISNGKKILGLCDDREISIWFSIEDKNGKPVQYGFDFGSSAILLPRTSAVFAVPHEVLKNGNAIRFGFTFQKETDENKIEDYGAKIILRFRESDLHK
jgi:WD40 repeat protein